MPAQSLVAPVCSHTVMRQCSARSSTRSAHPRIRDDRETRDVPDQERPSRGSSPPGGQSKEGEHVSSHSSNTHPRQRACLGRSHAPLHQLPGERFRRRAAPVEVRLGDQLPEGGDVPVPRPPHRLVPQYQHRGLDLPRHARQLRPGLDHQGPGLSRSQLAAPHHHRRRHQRLPRRAGLVLGVRLAVDLGRFAAGIPAAGLRLVLPGHQPVHPGLRDHDRRRRPEVLHAARPARAHHRRHAPLHPPPQLPRRDDDLRQLRADGVALAAGRGAGLGLGRAVRGQHDPQGGQPVALSRVAQYKQRSWWLLPLVL